MTTQDLQWMADRGHAFLDPAYAQTFSRRGERSATAQRVRFGSPATTVAVDVIDLAELAAVIFGEVRP